MAFKMHCPKCGGLDFSIERDNRTFGAIAQAYELVFHCRCGKQLFGEVLLKEYEQQKKTWEEREEAGLDPAGTPDARVQRIEDRLRGGRKPGGYDKRWMGAGGLDDEDGDEVLPTDDDESDAPSAPRGKAAAKGKAAKDAWKRKAAAAPVAKAKAGAGRAKKKGAATAKARPAKPAARGKLKGYGLPASTARKASASRPQKKDTRRPASVRLKAAAKYGVPASAARKASAAARVKPGAGRTTVAGPGRASVGSRGRGHEEHGTCIWPGCGKPTRANSKYCSRACSNKNARARHKNRSRKAAPKKSLRTSRSAKGR